MVTAIVSTEFIYGILMLIICSRGISIRSIRKTGDIFFIYISELITLLCLHPLEYPYHLKPFVVENAVFQYSKVKRNCCHL